MKCSVTITVLIILYCSSLYSQDLQYFFVDDVFQRTYINPALHKDKMFSASSGLMTGIGTDGPVYNDLVNKNTEGKYILDLADAVNSMDDAHNIFFDGAVHTLDLGVNLKVFRLSAGHAWKSSGFLQYTKDFAEIAAFGNAPFVSETKSLGPQIQYFNYNELYIGFQKYIGPISIGAKIKRLSGVQGIKTEASKIDITTDEDFYALTVDSDYTLNSSGAIDYFALDSINFNFQRLSFDNFMKGNNGWAFDLGASFDIGERLELSLSMIDIGSITWDTNAKSLTSKKVQTFDGIDLTKFVGTDDEIIVEDSIRALLGFVESNGDFSTTLPSQIYIGAKFQLSELWTLGALIHRMNYGGIARNAFALNATTQISVFKVGVQYTARSESIFNIGINGSAKVGPVTGFLSLDNILSIPDPLATRHSSIRGGISVSL